MRGGKPHERGNKAMMWKEFEEIAGYEVSYEDYTNVIEPMYMATNMSKQEFIKCLDRKRFALPTKAEMLRMMRKAAKEIYELCGHASTWGLEDCLKCVAWDFAKRFYGVDVRNCMTHYAYFTHEYEYPEIQRGCTYLKELVIGTEKLGDIARIALVK
jgi:hypothetical protein